MSISPPDSSTTKRGKDRGGWESYLCTALLLHSDQHTQAKAENQTPDGSDQDISLISRWNPPWTTPNSQLQHEQKVKGQCVRNNSAPVLDMRDEPRKKPFLNREGGSDTGGTVHFRVSGGTEARSGHVNVHVSYTIIARTFCCCRWFTAYNT